MDSLDNTPSHVALIMDGNGRWAAARGRERTWGHVSGTESVRGCIRAAARAGVRYLTFYTFSTENWQRPAEEVDTLMELLCDSVERESPDLVKEGVRVVAIGDRDGLSQRVQEHIGRIERETARGETLTVVLAINYSSRAEITRAASLIARDVVSGELSPRAITPQAISERLYTAGIPDPDLVIRTGGEQRLSNFLLWQASYAELYFTPVFWPDFGEEQFAGALAEYARRERRYGKIDQPAAQD